MGVKPYLRLTRAHTAPLEAVPAAVGASLALGAFWRVEVALWAVAGILYHLSGYGMNSYTDWKSGYDKNDPNKQHHPLNSGSISPKRAKLTVLALFILSAFYVVYLAFPSYAGMALIGLGVISGVVYNTHGKRMILKPIPISIAHTTMFLIPFATLYQGERLMQAILGALFVFLWVLYQIGISGDMKDIVDLDEYNTLRDIFSVIVREKSIEFSKTIHYIDNIQGVKRLSSLLKSLQFILGGVILLSLINFLSPQSVVIPLVYGVITLLSFQRQNDLLKPGQYNRHSRIRDMATVEMFSLIAFVLVFSPILGLRATYLLVFISGLWVLLFNRIEWGTWLAPEV